MAKLKIKKGDMVRIIAGDDKGKTGKVLSVSHRTVVVGERKCRIIAATDLLFGYGSLVGYVEVVAAGKIYVSFCVGKRSAPQKKSRRREKRRDEHERQRD